MAERLRTMGHEAVVAPLLEIRFRDGPEISLDCIQAILATSANGARAIARRTHRRDVPFFAVGSQTAAAANAQSFRVVRNAGGDAEALAASIPKWATPDKGALLLAAGAEAPKLLASQLTDSGFDVRRETLYEAIAVSELPTALEMYLRNGRLDAAIFMSPRSAQIFADLVAKAGLGASTETLDAFCISAACAKALSPLQFRNIRIADKPNQSAILQLVG